MSEENEYTGIIQQESAQELRQSMLESVDKNPDQEAKLQSLAKQYDLPVDAVRFDPGTVEKNAKLDAYDYESLVKNSPATSALVADPQKASIIHDDIHNTAAIEQAVKQFGLGPALKLQPTEFGKNVAKVAGAAAYQTSASLVGLAEAGVTNAKNLLSPILPDGVLPVDVFGQTLKGLQDIRHSQEAWRDYLTPKAETNFGKGVISGGMSLAQNAPLLAAGIYTGNPGLVLDSMAALTFGQTYGEDSDKGVPNSTATLHSVANAGWEKYTEGWSVNKLFGDLKAGSSVIKTMAHQIVPEVAGEQVATAMQGLNDWMVQHPEKPIAEYIETMPDAAQQTLIATFVGMGGNTALMKGYEALAHPTIKASAANQAAFDIERLNQVAAASKVLNRDPALIHELVTKATDDSPSQHLFMDANTLAQSGVADKVAEAIPDVARQLPDALKTGGEIRVSKADYTTAIAGTELAQQLVDHWRVEGEDFTRAEAQDFLQNHTQELADHVERVMNSRNVDDAFRASAEVVKQNIKQQLEATGRNIDDVNEAYSTLLSSYFAVNAAKLGITPEELHAKYPVNFASETQSGYQQDGQGPFGPVLSDYKGDTQGAISKLMELKSGEAIGALHHPDIGDIDLVWGEEGTGASDGYGIAKLAKYHPEVLDDLQGVISAMQVTSRSKNRINLESSDHRAGVRLTWDNQAKHWLLTAFKKKEGDAVDTTTDTVDLLGEDDTARPSNASDSIIDRKIEDLYQLFFQSGPEGGANAVTGDLERVNPAVRDAVESRIARLPEEDQQRIRDNLEQYKGTAWAAAAVKGMAYREMLDRAMRGEDISDLERNQIWGKQDMSATKLIQAFKKYPSHGERVLKLLLNAYDFIGGNRKAENDISTSFANCDPSKACAVHCYAAGSNARPNEIAKSEFTEFMIEHFPMEMADKISSDYLATEAGKSGLSLRLNDKGDLSPAQVKLIELLNDKGIAVQVFSKRPDLLRSLSDVNLKMLSVDGTNMNVADANPDLRLAVTITDEMTEEMLSPLQDRVSIYLPVNLKGKAVTTEELKARFPNLYGRMRRENLCPVDGGKLVTKPGTSFVDIRDKTADKGVWTCTACDLYGNAGCFKGDRKTNQRKAQTIMMSDLKRELETKRVRKELQANLETLLQLGGIDGELYSQLSQALSSGQRAVLEIADTERATRATGGTSGATEEGHGSGSGTGLDTSRTYNQSARGSFNPDTLTISLLKDADLSTFLHETGHFFLEMQFDLASKLQGEANTFGYDTLSHGKQEIINDTQALLSWFGVSDIDAWYSLSFEQKRPFHEQFAEGFEKYLAEGKSPSFDLQGVFNKFSAWMLSIYQSLKQMRVTLTPEVRGVMDRMIASKEQIQMAEQGRSMMPLFASKEHAEKLGVHIDNWDEYQSLGRDATNAAVAALQSKAYQDLQWASNARAKSLKRLQRQHDERRKEIKREVTTELMSQPVYRAWQFLTGKLPTADFYKTPSELDHQQAVADWKADKSQAEDDARQRHAEAWKNSYAYQQAEATGDKFKKIELRKNYIDAAVEMDMVNWEAANPRPKAPEKDSTVTDKGEVVYGKINRDDLLALKLPKDMAQKIIKLKMTADDGFSPDVLANLIPGFTSGADLVNAIGNALPPKEAIDEMTDQRMLAQYGNMATPEGIQKAADEAIYSDIRAKFIAKEFNTLASAIGERKILAQAAKEIADQMIAKLRVRDIRPQQYATAQARAAKNAEKATKAGKTDVAAHEKRNELINVYATKAAYAALDDAEKIVRYLKRVQKPGKIPARHHDQIMSLLSKFSLANETLKSLDNAARFRTWAKGQIDAGNVPPNVILLLTPEQRASYLKELDRRNDDGELIYPHEEDQMLLLAEFIDAIPVRNYKEVSIEELRGLRDTIKQIEHIGRRTEKVLTDRKNRNFADVVETIRANITAVAANQNRVASDTISPTDKKGQQLLSWRGYFFSHIKIANLIHIIDGKEGGPLWEHLMKTANDAGNTEVIELAKAHDDIKALLMPLKAIGDITDKAIPFPTLGRSLNRQERIVMAMNMGNDSNIQRLLGGSGWTLADIQPALDTLTAADWRFVQSMWDYFETYRPRVGAMEEMINGVQPEWIEAKPMTVKTADGQTIKLKGGYAPVIYDPRASGKAASFAAEKDAKAMMQAARVASTVSKSFTKQRVDEVKGRPLMLSLDAMIGGVQDTIHYLNWQPWIIDANRLIKALDPQIRTYYGAEVVKQFRDWAGDNAAGMKPARDAAERLVVSLSRNVSYAGLAFNVVSALKQVTGYTQSIAIIGSKAMAQGVAMSIVNPRKAYLDAVNKSSFMRKRADTRMRDLAETRNTVQDQSMVREMLDKTGYSMMLAMQTLVDVPTWWGAYGKYIDQGQDEAMAIAMADQAVIDAQGSGMQKDLASVERATGAIRLLTGFMSFSNTTLNINYRTLKSDTNIGDKAATLMLVNALPVAMMIAIDQAVSALAGGDGDDEDKMANKMASGFFSSLLSQLVGIRELSQIYNAFAGNPGSDYSGAVGTRLAADTINLAKQVGQGDMDASLRRALINFAGETMRLPAAQINRTITGLEAINDGQTDSPFALAFGFHN